MTRFRVLRYIAYTIEIIVFFIIQQTPGLIPSVYGILPTLLIPIACSIAMFEGPVCSLLYGVFSGFLLDYGANCTFGFHALILGLICFIISFLVQDVFHNNFLTGLIMILSAILIVILLQWLFLYILRATMQLAMYSTVITYLVLLILFCWFLCFTISIVDFPTSYAKNVLNRNAEKYSLYRFFLFCSPIRHIAM